MYIEQKQDRILKPHSVYTKSAQEDNQITTELLNLITEAGLTPSADDLTQVKTAVLSLGGGGSGHMVGEIVSSTLPITDAGFHLLDGALISGSGTYAAFVDYIGDLYDGGSYSGLFETEANWQAAVTAYGVCGKFVYDSVNNTVRLPKITGIIEGTTDTTALGDLVAAGLPNITGNLAVWANSGTWGLVSDGAASNFNAQGGAFQTKTAGYTQAVQTGKSEASENIDFDASRSSSIYGNSSTVQPQTIKVLYYIVIATTTKTDIQADIDQIASDLNGKADVDLTNCTKPHIVETYVNGTSWYRVYSDGWCEQGGYVGTGPAPTTVTLLKQMADTNYKASVQQANNGGGNPQHYSSVVIGITTTTITVNQFSNYFFPYFWEVKGYIE